MEEVISGNFLGGLRATESSRKILMKKILPKKRTGPQLEEESSIVLESVLFMSTVSCVHFSAP